MDRLSEIIKTIKPIDKAMMENARKRLDNLTKPVGSLGRLEEVARTLAGIKSVEQLKLERKVIFTLAGDHGVVEEGVSAFPQEVTAQMVYNFLRGGAGINVLARHAGADIVVADLGVKEELEVESEKCKVKKVGLGTRNMAKGPATTKEEAIKSTDAGN